MARSDTRDAPPRRRRSFLQGLLYWGAVLCVWGLIFALAFLAVFAADLPDTSNLNAVRRQPSISYLDRSGAIVSVRGSQYAPPVDLEKLPPYVPAAFVARGLPRDVDPILARGLEALTADFGGEEETPGDDDHPPAASE